MSSQTGIAASEKLKKFFATCRDGRIRLIKVSISDEPALELDESHESGGSWEEDFDRLVPRAVEDDQPAYFLYRTDDTDGPNWIFLSWSPDHAPPRQKMLYAATKATFKNEFGQGQIKHEVYANMKSEMSLAGFKRHLAVGDEPAPLSREEEEMKLVNETETRVEISIDTKHQTISSLAFPFDKAALAAIEDYQRKGADYLQFSIDLAKETIMLQKKSVCDIEDLPSQVPEDAARYHLLRFKHTHEGDYLESTIFIYSMPGYSVPIKERMMYSSCKNAVLEILQKHYTIPIEKSIEVDSGGELTEQFLQEELHPVKSLNRPKFARPAPPNKGNRRITKAPVS